MSVTCLPATAQPARTILVSQTNPDASHATIQAALNDAHAGDTVLVEGGVYTESLSFPRSGEPARPITLKAANQQIVLITPTQPLAGQGEPAAGLEGVFVWKNVELPNDLTKTGLWETASHIRMIRVHSPLAAQSRLGSWYYNQDTGDLYVRSTGAAPAGELIYHFEDQDRPAIHVEQSHIIIDGVQAAFGAHGILIGRRGSDHVTVRNSRLFCNRSAGIHVTGIGHRIENNVVYRNNQYGIQLRFGVEDVQVRNNLGYYNGPNNGETTDSSQTTDIGMYSRSKDVLFEGNVIDGLHQSAYRNKYGGNNSVIVRNNVVRGDFDCSSLAVDNNTVIVTGVGPRIGTFINHVNPSPGGDMTVVDPLGRIVRSNLVHPALHDQDPRFADPAYLDFRLQDGSPYLGRGAHPGRSSIIYVDPNHGDDNHNGLRLDQPIRTLARLTELMFTSDTVYLLPGRYDEHLHIKVGGLNQHEPLRIRAHGRSDDVVLAGGITLENVKHVELEHLTLVNQPLTLKQAQHIRVTQTVLADQQQAAVVLVQGDPPTPFSNASSNGAIPPAYNIEPSRQVVLNHVTIHNAAVGLAMQQSQHVSLTNSLLVDVPVAVQADDISLATYYSDHNHYSQFAVQAASGSYTSLAQWVDASGLDRHSNESPVTLGQTYALPSGSSLSFAAADYSYVGARPEAAADRLQVADLAVEGLSPHGASLLWRTPRGLTEARVEVRDMKTGKTWTVQPRLTFQVMGEFFDMTFRQPGFFTANRHASLQDLQPGRTYQAVLTVRNIENTSRNTQSVQFTTPAEYAQPRTYYVAVDGDDTHDGLTAASAWATFEKAASKARPGDVVMVLPGHYAQSLTPRTSGTPGHPITYRSAEPHAAVIDMAQALPVGIELANVDYIHVEGFAFTGRGEMAGGHNFLISSSRGSRIAGCKVGYPDRSSWERLRLGNGGLVAAHAPGLILEDNQLMCGYVGFGLAASPGAIVRHNTIVGEGNYGVVIVPDHADETYTVVHNLFVRAIMGYKTGPQIWMMNVQAELTSDHNVFFIPEDHKATIGKLPATDRLTTLHAWQQATRLDTHSLQLSELDMLNPEGGDFRLTHGSPATGAGVRW